MATDLFRFCFLFLPPSPGSGLARWGGGGEPRVGRMRGRKSTIAPFAFACASSSSLRKWRVVFLWSFFFPPSSTSLLSLHSVFITSLFQAPFFSPLPLSKQQQQWLSPSAPPPAPCSPWPPPPPRPRSPSPRPPRCGEGRRCARSSCRARGQKDAWSSTLKFNQSQFDPCLALSLLFVSFSPLLDPHHHPRRPSTPPSPPPLRPLFDSNRPPPSLS